MSISYNKIALGIAFSPTAEAMLSETSRLAQLFSAEVLLIHVGKRTTESEGRMNEMITRCNLTRDNLNIVWGSGDPATVILDSCKKHHVDLLVTGALKKENLVQYYVGTIARKILRKARCSVLTLINPSKEPKGFKNVVVSAEDSSYIKDAISTACQFVPRSADAWVHIVRELKLYGLTMAASDQYTEAEYDNVRQDLVKQEVQKVEEILQRVPHEGLKINIKMVSGKSGFELTRFAGRKNADLLVVGAPPRRFSFLDRMFPHDTEYILADLPCNLLIVQPSKYKGTSQKEAANG
jgi:nucleotide-binding universal stress UspA family protein